MSGSKGRILILLLVFLLLIAPVTVLAGVSTPPQDLIPYDDIAGELAEIVANSDRVKVEVIGQTVAGRDMYLVTVADSKAMGKLDQVGSRSEVYSVGALLYTLLTGWQPYAEPGIGVSPRTVLAAVLQGPPRRIESIDPTIPGELVAIAEKAMRRKAEERYAEVSEIASELRAYMDGRVVLAYRTGTLVELRKWVLRNKIAAMGIAAAVLCLIAGVIATSVYESKKKQEIIADLLIQAEQFTLNQKYGAAEKTYFSVLGLDAENPEAREGIARVSGKALAEKSWHGR